MCNHYTKGQKKWERDLIEWTQRLTAATIPLPLPEFKEHVYPKYAAPIVMQEGGAVSLVAMRWGVLRFIGPGKMKEVTNARNDKLGKTWKKPVESRRCLIPATGYFEPGLGPVGAKGEILFTVRERPMFFIAGLWDTDPGESGERAFTMVTTDPNDLVRTYHDRMPVVLAESQAKAWLGERALSEGDLSALCRGLAPDELILETLPPKLKISRPGKPADEDQQPGLL